MTYPTEAISERSTQHNYAVLILSLCGFFLIYKYILQNFPSVIASQLMTSFDLHGLGLGMLASVYFWTYLIVPLFVGFIVDRYGVRWITTGAILCCAVGILWFSQVHDLSVAVFSRALIGVGVSFATIAYMKLATTWFSPNKYAFLVGLIVSSAMAGAICGQMPLAWLVHFTGWRNALAILGMLGLLLAVLFAWLVRDTPHHFSKVITNKPPGLKEILNVFKDKQNWLLMLYSGLSFSPVVIFGGLWGNPFLQTAYGIDTITASSLMSLVFLGLGLGGPVFALIANLFEKKTPLMIYTTLISALSLSVVLLYHPMPIWGVATLLFIFGFALGAFSLVFVIGKELNPIALAGTAMAMINASEALLDAVTEPLIGKFLDLFGSPVIIEGVRHFSLHGFHLALFILPIYQILGSVLLFWVKEKPLS